MCVPPPSRELEEAEEARGAAVSLGTALSPVLSSLFTIQATSAAGWSGSQQRENSNSCHLHGLATDTATHHGAVPIVSTPIVTDEETGEAQRG